MISISCLESKLLNNNNWYGRFQLAPFQKGEGLTVANALRRTLLAEKRAFFITWVDFYNAEIPYSVLTGMRESIFDILLNLKQVIFTSDKILSRQAVDNSSSAVKMRSNNSFKAQKLKKACEPLLLNQSTLRLEEGDQVLPITKRKTISKTLLRAGLQNVISPSNELDGVKNQNVFTTQNVFCENQILGKIVNSQNKTSLRIFHKYRSRGDFKNQLLDTRFSVTSQNGLRVPKKMSDSTYIGYICAKGPTTIYAKNIKLPKGLKCVDPDKYITTLADDGLFYLRFELTTTLKTLSLTDTSNKSNDINQGIKFNRVRFRIFPKTLLNKEIQSCFNSKTDSLMLYQESKSKKSNQYDLNTSQIPFFESHSKSLLKVKREPQTNNPPLQGKPKYPLYLFRPQNAKNSMATYVQDTTRGPVKCYGSNKESIQGQDFQQWPVHFTRPCSDLINEQYLLLTNDRIKQAFFQNTSIIANIQKTCLLDIQIKHYYYKCGRFDRFLFDLIKPFKPDLIPIHYKKSGLKNNKPIFSQDRDWKVSFFDGTNSKGRIFGRQKSNSYLLIDYKPKNVKKALFIKKPHFKRGSERADKLSNRFRLQSHVKFSRAELDSQTLQSNFFGRFTPLCFVSKHTRSTGNMGWKSLNGIPNVRSRNFSQWQQVFQFLRTNSIYHYLQKLNTSQAARIYRLLTHSSAESKILLLGSQLVLNNDSEAKLLSTTLASILKNRYLKSDLFSFDNLWLKENTEKQLSQFLFREFVGPPVNKLTGGFQIQKNSDFRIDHEQIFNTSNTWQILRLHELYIKKFLNLCFSFQCSKNHILYFLKFYILQNNNLPVYREGNSFLNRFWADSVHIKNILRYSPFKFGLIDTEKLITKIKFLRQWSFLGFKHKKQTNISLLNKKTRDCQETSLFPWIENSFLIRQTKSPRFHYMGRELLYPLLQSQNKTSKYDIHLREFFYSKNSLPIVMYPSLNNYPYLSPSGYTDAATWPEGKNERNGNDWPKKTGFLSTPPVGSSRIPRGDQSLNSVQISTNLRAKPNVSIQQVSYKLVWSLPYQVEKNTPVGAELPLWCDNLNLGSPKQNLINNNIVLKPIYLNVEQIIYVLKQTTRFRKNQRINPVFFDCLTRLKNKKRYPLDYSSLFSKRSTRLYNSFYKRYFFNNWVSSYFGFHFQTRSGFFRQGNTGFYERKINQRKTIHSYFLDAKIPVKDVSNTFYTQRPVNYHVRILGNDFVFKNNYREKKQLVPYSSKMDKNLNAIERALPFCGYKKATRPLFSHLRKQGVLGWRDNRFFLASSVSSNYSSLVSIKDSSKLRPGEGLSKKPYNINIYHSIISFNLRYTYPFKSTIFKTFLPFLTPSNELDGEITFFNNLIPHLNTSKKICYSLRPCADFDHIQYNESFKIYTSLAYTCLKTYEAHLPKYHNFNRRNQKQFQNHARKVISFQPLPGGLVRQGEASRVYPAGADKHAMLFESLIQDWPFFQNKNGTPLPEKNEKSNSYPFLIRPYGGFQLPSILNYRSAAYYWPIMNTLSGTNFNDAFIIIPCTWFLYPHRDELYESRNLKRLRRKTTASVLYSLVPPLQKLFYMNGIFKKNQNEKKFFESFGKKKEIIKNKLDWLKTTSTTNELSWLGSYTEKKTKNFYDFTLNSRQADFDKEDTRQEDSVNPLTNSVPKKASFLTPSNELDSEIRPFNELNRQISSFEQTPSHREDFQRPIISLGGFKIKRSIKKLAMNFENIYYKNLLWNSRKITLRVLNNAILPLVTNRKYSISNFLPKKNPRTGGATRFLNIRDTAREPVSSSLNPKFSNCFIWGFKQRIRPYSAPFNLVAGVFKTDVWSHKKPNNIVLKKSRKKNWLDQSYLFNEFSGGANPIFHLYERKIYHDGKSATRSFYSVRHKTLGTTNFMCSKTYPTFINENATQNISAGAESNSSIRIPKESAFENNFSYTNSTLSNQTIDEFSPLKKRKAPPENYLSSLTPPLKPISGEEITNESYTQKSRSYRDFFSESFSSLRSKWKPFLMGSLKYSQEKTTGFGLPFIDFATQHKKSAPFNLVAEENQRFAENSFKSRLMDNIWSSLFFCSYSLYAISTRSDLFFQNLINNDNWTPSTNKTEIPQINSRNYIKNLQDFVHRGYREKSRKLFFRDSLINSKANNKMQLQDEQSNSDEFRRGYIKSSPPAELYYETIQKILLAEPLQGPNHKSSWRNRIVPNYDYYWQKAIHLIILNRFQIPSTEFNNQKKKVRFNGYKNHRMTDSFFLQYSKRNLSSGYTSQNSISELKNRYSIRRLKNFERYFGNPLRRYISQNRCPLGIPVSFCNILLPPPAELILRREDPPRSEFKKANQQIKSWKSIIWTVNANKYFCFRYPLFIQNCNLPWQKSKRVFGIQKNGLSRHPTSIPLLYLQKGNAAPIFKHGKIGGAWMALNRNGKSLKRLSSLNRSTDFSKRPRREIKNINVVLNTKLVMTYTQLSSSSNETHQLLLDNKLWTNIILPINRDLQIKGSYGMIGYFTVKESLNSIYKVNYVVESQASESKSMSELAFHSVGPRSSNLTRNSNQSDSERSLQPQNSIENFHNMKRFDNIERNSVNTDALTVSSFLNGTYSFVPSKTIILNRFNPLINSQLNRSTVENEDEYIQIDIWTNGELSPRQALLNAFRKLFELFYNLSKYNCLKPIEI